jgi:hypothetical protein
LALNSLSDLGVNAVVALSAAIAATHAPNTAMTTSAQALFHDALRCFGRCVDGFMIRVSQSVSERAPSHTKGFSPLEVKHET